MHGVRLVAMPATNIVASAATGLCERDWVSGPLMRSESERRRDGEAETLGIAAQVEAEQRALADLEARADAAVPVEMRERRRLPLVPQPPGVGEREHPEPQRARRERRVQHLVAPVGAEDRAVRRDEAAGREQAQAGRAAAARLPIPRGEPFVSGLG